MLLQQRLGKFFPPCSCLASNSVNWYENDNIPLNKKEKKKKDFFFFLCVEHNVDVASEIFPH